jgi:hypothetical protein
MNYVIYSCQTESHDINLKEPFNNGKVVEYTGKRFLSVCHLKLMFICMKALSLIGV